MDTNVLDIQNYDKIKKMYLDYINIYYLQIDIIKNIDKDTNQMMYYKEYSNMLELKTKILKLFIEYESLSIKLYQKKLNTYFIDSILT
jgi:hypothetical protein